jgi:hypothetical protein
VSEYEHHAPGAHKWAWDDMERECLCVLCKASIPEALQTAEQRGRQQGVEEAARVADREANTFNETLTRAERDAEYLKARAISREIRALAESRENQKESGS